MDITTIAQIAKFALDAESRMEGAAAGATALSTEFRKKLDAGSLSKSDVEEWLKAIQSNMNARNDAAAEFFGAVRLLGQVLKSVD